MDRGDPARLVRVVFGQTLIDGAEVRQVLVLGEGQSDLQHETVHLRVQLHSEERHEVIFIRAKREGRGGKGQRVEGRGRGGW